MKALIVGDLHGNWESLNYLIESQLPDVVLCCGDFGWWPVNKYNKKDWTKGIKPGKAKIYWCDGNHENHSCLPQDGKIHEMYEGVFFCSRGSKLTLPDGRTVLFAGGADSIDKNRRTPGYDWFPEEVINNKDLDKMLNVGKVDIVVSHTCPTSFLSRLRDGNSDKVQDPSCVALEHVLNRCKPTCWFFGHWHIECSGVNKGCSWYALDYPWHLGRWWIDLI